MSEFKREKRYQVIKLSNPNWKGSCVVVEDDWPEYEIVWKMIQDRIEGKPNIIEQLSAANKRIEELLDLVEVVERRNKQLEERIRVADAEEPVLWMFTVDGRYYTAKSKAHADSMLNHPDTHLYPDKPEDFPLSPLYLHAQIPAEVELKAKIAELEAIIKASQEQEPVGYTFVVWDGRVRREHLAIDYMVQYDKVYGWEEIRGKTPLYAVPVIKEQP